MGEVYVVTIKEKLKTSEAELNKIRKSYVCLKNKESEYARDIMAYIQILGKVRNLYADAVDAL